MKYPTPTIKQPAMSSLERALNNESNIKATDGCRVEPDGTCPHGHPSWLLRLGLI